jgi:hypothetical protein
VFHRFSLWFYPQPRNNHRALLLQPASLGILIAVYLLNQSLIKSLTIIKPGVLGYSSEITVEKVVSQTNEQRRHQGLPALKFNSSLAQSAQAKAQDMFANNYWAHNSPQGKTPWDFFRAVKYDYSVAGENLAKDFYDTDTLIAAWMKSPTHRANMVNSKYQEIGIAVVNGTLNGVKTTLVVQHFGTPLNPKLIADNPLVPPANAQANFDVVTPKSNLETPELPASYPRVSPLFLAKLTGSIMFLIILTVLVVDSVVVLKNKTYRLTGSTTGHVGFLLIILMLLIFSRQGAIF